MENKLFLKIVSDKIPISLFPCYDFFHEISKDECFLEIGNISIHLEGNSIWIKSDAFCLENDSVTSATFEISEIEFCINMFVFLLRQQKNWKMAINRLL